MVDAGLMALIDAKVQGAAGAKFGEWLAKRAVMTPLNVTVDELNRQATEDFPGETGKYRPTK